MTFFSVARFNKLINRIYVKLNELINQFYTYCSNGEQQPFLFMFTANIWSFESNESVEEK